MNGEWTIYNMQSNAAKFDNVWQLRPSSSNSFSGETFATRQAFESNLRINWKCKVLFEGAILHMSGRQNVGSSKQSYCENASWSLHVPIYSWHTSNSPKYRKSTVRETGAPAEAIFQTSGLIECLLLGWPAYMVWCLLDFLVFFHAP